MPKIEREIFAGDKTDLRKAVEDLNRVMGLFNNGTRIYIAEAPTFRQVIYDLVSRGFNALGFMGVFDAVILLDPDGDVKSITLLHGYDEMGQLSTETIWPLPQEGPLGIKYHLPEDCSEKKKTGYHADYDGEITCSLCKPNLDDETPSAMPPAIPPK